MNHNARMIANPARKKLKDIQSKKNSNPAL